MTSASTGVNRSLCYDERPKSTEGGLSLTNLYFPMTRRIERTTIRLLKDFDSDLFLQAHAASFSDEDDRRYAVEGKTTQWWAEVI